MLRTPNTSPSQQICDFSSANVVNVEMEDFGDFDLIIHQNKAL